MTDNGIIRTARFLRPIMRRRTPVLYRLAKWTAQAVCPKGTPQASRRLIAPFEGGRIHVDTASSIEYHLLFRGCHEPVITDLIRKHVTPGATCIDVGANVGAHTLIMAAATGASGRIVALEPHPGLCVRLRANIALNAHHHVAVIEAALSDADATATFYGYDADEFNQGISGLHKSRGATVEMRVRTITGGTLQRESRISTCDFIKIDVEGHEAVAIQQLWPLIEKATPTLIFEYRKAHWAKSGQSPTALLADLRQMGYSLHVIHRQRTSLLADGLPDSAEILAVS